MTTVKNYLYMVIILGELDSLHRNHEIYLILHDLRFKRDDQSGRRGYNTIWSGQKYALS
jgi:hypothetical protein